MGDDHRDARVECARWFIDHDEVDEAARVLEPEDRVVLGSSDYLGLAAALARRGLGARYEDGQATVLHEPMARSRKPPARAAIAVASAAKKTA